MVHHGSDQGFEVVGDVTVDENSRNDEFEQAKEERERLLEEANDYNIKKGNLRRRY